jgi:TrkA-C domain.
MVALVSRGEENTVPEAELELEYGDHLTILGRTEAVDEAMDRLHPHD